MKIIHFLSNLRVFKRIFPSIIKKILRIIGKNKFIIKFKNIYLEININEPMDKLIFFYNAYEEKQITFLTKKIKKIKPHIFLDIGANSGIYSLLVAKKFTKIKIFAFEPVKDAFLKFKKNIILNDLKKKIKVYNFGLSNKKGWLKMKTLIKNNYIQLGGYGVVKNNEKNLPNNLYARFAKFEKGDEILNFRKKTIFCKIDVEGHEINVLSGLKKIIKNNKFFLQIEIFDKKYKIVDLFLKKNKFSKVAKIYDENKYDYYYKNF